MPTLQPMATFNGAVSNTNYAAVPTLSAPGGVVAVCHLGVLGDPVVRVSFDGVTDHMVLTPGTLSGSQKSDGKSYGQVWLKTASGSPNVYINIESRLEMG